MQGAPTARICCQSRHESYPQFTRSPLGTPRTVISLLARTHEKKERREKKKERNEKKKKQEQKTKNKKKTSKKKTNKQNACFFRVSLLSKLV